MDVLQLVKDERDGRNPGLGADELERVVPVAKPQGWRARQQPARLPLEECQLPTLVLLIGLKAHQPIAGQALGQQETLADTPPAAQQHQCRRRLGTGLKRRALALPVNQLHIKHSMRPTHELATYMLPTHKLPTHETHTSGPSSPARDS